MYSFILGSILATAIREISRDKDFLNTPNKPVGKNISVALNFYIMHKQNLLQMCNPPIVSIILRLCKK